MLIEHKKNATEKATKLKKEVENKFNIGLAFLRPILSFFVVITHFYNNKSFAKGYWKLILLKAEKFFFHVRIFFIMAFYFSYKTLVSNDCKKKIIRLERLCIPYFLWPIIFFFLNNIFRKYFRMKYIFKFKVKDLKEQLYFGHGYIFSFWYQWNLIFITIFFILIILLFKKNHNFIFIIINIISFNFQYNGKNIKFFGKYNYIKRTVGRIIEMLPLSGIGFIIASSGILNFFKKYILQTIIVCIYIIYLLLYYDIFTKKKGFLYNGLKMYFVSICIFIIFAIFPLEKLKNKIILSIIKQITNYTAGIYFIHLPIRDYLKLYIKTVKNRTMKGCIIIYLVCYFICFLGTFIFGKTKLRNLFV